MKINLSLVIRLVVAVLLIQTLRFKFTGAEESIYIFTKVGMEPFGRIGIGVLELIAAILLLIPKTIWAGAVLTVGIIAGAIMMHLTILGIEVLGDNGTLFYMAVLIFVLGLIILWQERNQTPILKNYFS